MTSGMFVGVLSALAVVLLHLSSGRIRRPGHYRPARLPERGAGDAPMILDLLGAVLSAGASVENALSIVAGSCEPRIGAALHRVHAARLLGASWDTAWDTASDLVRGASEDPASDLVRGEPGDARGGTASVTMDDARTRPARAASATRAAGPTRATGSYGAPARRPVRSRQRQQRRAAQRSSQCVTEIRQGLRFAVSTGAPSAALLHAHAAQLRRRHNRDIDRRAAALGVQLVLPLGLCSLPAFICLGVVPVVLGLLPTL